MSNTLTVDDNENFYTYCSLLPSSSLNQPLGGVTITMENYEDLFSTTIEIRDEAKQWSKYEVDEILATNAEEIILHTTEKATFVLRRPKYSVQANNSILEVVKYAFPIKWHKFVVARYTYFENQSLMFLPHEYMLMTPCVPNIFHSLDLTPPDAVKVCIIAGEPYRQTGIATGLAFAVSRAATYEPPAIRNIFDEIYREFPGTKIRSTADVRGFVSWATQGVFMLNITMTTRREQSNAHTNQWAGNAEALVKFICKRNEKIVFMLWGREAQSIKRAIGGNHLILETTHPGAPNNGGKDTFAGCNHFKLANDNIIKNKKTPINWTI